MKLKESLFNTWKRTEPLVIASISTYFIRFSSILYIHKNQINSPPIFFLNQKKVENLSFWAYNSRDPKYIKSKNKIMAGRDCVANFGFIFPFFWMLYFSCKIKISNMPPLRTIKFVSPPQQVVCTLCLPRQPGQPIQRPKM